MADLCTIRALRPLNTVSTVNTVIGCEKGERRFGAAEDGSAAARVLRKCHIDRGVVGGGLPDSVTARFAVMRGPLFLVHTHIIFADVVLFIPARPPDHEFPVVVPGGRSLYPRLLPLLPLRPPLLRPQLLRMRAPRPPRVSVVVRFPPRPHTVPPLPAIRAPPLP